MEKKCFKCGQVKDLSLFYKHEAMTDGHLGKCKKCTKADVAKHRLANIDKIRKYDLDRAKLPHRKLSAAKYRKKFRRENPLAGPAHCMVARAIKDGKIKKPKKCSRCDKKGKVLAHHKDYYKPLEVIWVCQVCHKQIHKEIKNETRT
jgi:hypothetical protein